MSPLRFIRVINVCPVVRFDKGVFCLTAEEDFKKVTGCSPVSFLVLKLTNYDKFSRSVRSAGTKRVLNKQIIGGEFQLCVVLYI